MFALLGILMDLVIFIIPKGRSFGSFILHHYTGSTKVENESDFLTLIREVLGSERVRDVLSRIVSYDDDF